MWNQNIICIYSFHIINFISRVGQLRRKKCLRLVGCENVIIHKGHRGRVLLSDVYMTSCCDCQIIEPSCQSDIWRFRVIESSMRLHISSYFMSSRMKFSKCIMQCDKWYNFYPASRVIPHLHETVVLIFIFI